MQIMHNCRMPLMKHAMNGFGRLVGLLVSIAVDINESVFRPIRRRLTRQGRTIRFYGMV